ncbi:MAG: hypothetical protein ACRCSY_08495 [Cetobacterium sp.]
MTTKQIIKELLLISGLSAIGGFLMYALLFAPVSTEQQLMDKIAYKQLLLEATEGGVVSHADKLVKVNEEIKELRQRLAEENQKARYSK